MSSSTFRTLTFRSTIDTKGFDSGIVALTGKTNVLTRDIGARLGDLTPAFDKVNKGFAAAGEGAGSKGSKAADAMVDQAGRVASAFLPVGAAIAGVMVHALGQVKSVMKDIGKTLSRQLDDGFNFAKAQDGIKTTKDLYEHEIKAMKADLATLASSGSASTATLFARMKAQIRDAEAEFRKFLLHSQANLKKGGTLPSFDTFFTNKSKTYDGKGAKGGGKTKVGAVVGSLNPLKMLPKLADSGSSSLFRLGVAGTAVGVAIGSAGLAFGFLAKGIKSASDLNETVSKTRQVLKDASPAVEAFADTMASKFGLVKGTTLDVASGLGGLAKGLGGLKGDQLAGFTTQFTSLAADLSSFKNIDLKTAGDALRTGLSGEQSDQLKALGVVMTEDTVKAKAYAIGIAQVGQELNEQQKFAARAAVIQAALNKLGATGDLERTADGTANQYRKLMGTIENLGTTVGTVLLPVVNAGVGLIGDLVSKASAAFESSKGWLTGWVDSAVDGIDVVSSVANNFPAAFEVARLKIYEALVNIGERFEVLGPNAILVAKYIGDNWLLLIGDAFDATVTGLKNLYKNFEAFGKAAWDALAGKGFHFEWTPLLDGLQTAAGKFPELIKPALTDMSAEIAEAARPITDDLAARRAKRAADKLKTPGAAAPEPPGDPEAPAKAGKAKNGRQGEAKLLAGAEEVGTKEAYSSVVKAIAGSKGSSVQDKQLGAQRQANGLLGRIDKGVNGKKPPMILKF